MFYAPTASAHGEKSQAAFMRMRTIHWFDLNWSKAGLNWSLAKNQFSAIALGGLNTYQFNENVLCAIPSRIAGMCLQEFRE